MYAQSVRLKFLKLRHYQSNRLLEHFVAGVPARTAADFVGLNRRTAIHFYHRLAEPFFVGPLNQS
ncbi:MAG: hypothetical protein WBO24_15350 [Nitrospirales bacterium]